MSLSNNLRTLRKIHDLSQEEFADKLDVSRQAVSKRESGEAYPETEKIIMICDLFDCKMDDLVRGDIANKNDGRNNPVAAENYDKVMTRSVRGRTLGLTIILLGVSLMLTVRGLLPDQNLGGVIGAIIVIISVILALPSTVLGETQARNFRQVNPKLANVYTNEIAAQEKMKYTKLFVMGVAVILLGVVVLMILLTTSILTDSLAVAVLMYFITVGESLVFYASKMLGKYDIEKYNHQNTPEYRARVKLAGKINGVVMVGAAMIFVIWGTVTNSWEMNWLVFLVAVLLCVIVNMILERGRRIR